MDIIFMNSRNSKTSDPHRLLPNLSDKIDLKKSDEHVALPNLSIHYTWKNVKKLYKNNKFKISSPTWNDKLELPDGSYSVSNIQGLFEKNMEKRLIILHLRIYVNEIENRTTFKIKTGLTPETMKLLGSTIIKKTKDENGENMPHLEITEVV